LDVAGSTRLTQTGVVIGTPQYMSPEQAASETVDHRSDQYSLACTLYEMLIGQPPFVGPSSHAVIARHMVDPVPSLRVVRQTVPPAVEGAIMQAMAKLPADRFPTMHRFVDVLAPAPVAETLSPPPWRGRRSARRAMAMLGVSLVIAGAAWWIVAGRARRRAGFGGRSVTSLAVLPFRDPGSNPDTSYLAAGMTDGLIADLSQIGSLRVIARGSGTAAQETARSLAQLASDLGVEAVVLGSIHRSGDSVRVGVKLLQAPDSTLLFTAEYQSRVGEMPDLQRSITKAITAATRAPLKSTERRRLETPPPRRLDQRSYEAYLRGRFYLEQGELEPARTQFEQAIRMTSGWAPPYVGLATYYTSLPFFTDIPPVQVLPKARAALSRALELDESLAEAHATNAYIRAYYEWDWRSAEQEFRRALELQPNYADAYFSYSRFLASRRRLDEAIAQLERAVELDPLSLSLQANRALLSYFAGRYREADSLLRVVLKSDSTDVLAKWGLALVAEQEGRLDDAIAILGPLGGSSLNRKSSLGHAYGIAGRSAEARRVLAELRAAEAKSYVPSYYFALVYVGLGERAEALRSLERAYEERSTVLAYLRIDPRLAPLRNDPRFLTLAKRLEGE
jgi:TolB-like protein